MDCLVLPVRRAGRPSKYPWAEWADGQVHDIFTGKDFTCGVLAMTSALHDKAEKLNLRCDTKQFATFIRFRFTPITPRWWELGSVEQPKRSSRGG